MLIKYPLTDEHCGKKGGRCLCRVSGLACIALDSDIFTTPDCCVGVNTRINVWEQSNPFVRTQCQGDS